MEHKREIKCTCGSELFSCDGFKRKAEIRFIANGLANKGEISRWRRWSDKNAFGLMISTDIFMCKDCLDSTWDGIGKGTCHDEIFKTCHKRYVKLNKLEV